MKIGFTAAVFAVAVLLPKPPVLSRQFGGPGRFAERAPARGQHSALPGTLQGTQGKRGGLLRLRAILLAELGRGSAWQIFPPGVWVMKR